MRSIIGAAILLVLALSFSTAVDAAVPLGTGEKDLGWIF